MNNLSTIARNVGAGELIDFFIREFPHIGRRIKQAKNAGHDIQDILNELQGLDKKELKAREKKASLVDKGNNPLISASEYSRQNSAQERNVLTPKNVGIAGMGALAATAAATALSPLVSTAASSLINQALEQPNPTQPLQPGPGLGQQVQQQAQSAVMDAMQPAQPGQVAQAAQAIPSQTEPQQSIFQQLTAGVDTANLDPAKQQQLQFLNMISDDFESKGKTLADPEVQKLAKKIKDVLKGNPGTVIREGARAEVGKSQPQSATKDIGNQFKTAFETLKGGAISEKLYEGIFKSLEEGKDTFSGVKEPLLQAAKGAYDAGQIKSVEDLKKFQKIYEESKNTPAKQENLAKGSIVSSSEGVGEVKGISNGKAIVEIDGKTKKIDLQDLEPPSFTDDEVADAYDNLMNKIPEEHKSGFISWSGYDEDRNVLGFIPRGGKYEEITNITPEEAEKIKQGKGVARTTGETREGLWIQGEDTRGGIISQIIHDRRKKNKAKEDLQLKFSLDLPKQEKQDRGMKPIFDEMEFARNKSRDREKVLKEQDEAKKRKK